MKVRRETASAGEADGCVESFAASSALLRMNCWSQPDCMSCLLVEPMGSLTAIGYRRAAGVAGASFPGRESAASI
jgi:hypothetical protein